MSEDSHVNNTQKSTDEQEGLQDQTMSDKLVSVASPLQDSVALGSSSSLSPSSRAKASTESSSTQQMQGARVGTPSLKLFVYNLRDFDNRKDFKKLLTKHNVKFKNCQKRRAKHIRYGFVTFDDDASLRDALIKIPKIVYRGKNLVVSDNVTRFSNSKSAKGARKRESLLSGRSNCGEKDSKRQRLEESGSDIPKDIRDQIMPLWKLKYDEQLQLKNEEMAAVLKKIKRKLRKDLLKVYKKDVKNSGLKAFDRLPKWIASRDFEGKCCEYSDICPSPVKYEYRNKCEFTVGKDKAGQVCVGFRFGTFGQSLVVARPHECSVCPKQVLLACDSFNKFLLTSRFLPYDQLAHRGTWRQMTVKFSSTSSHMMVILQVNIDGSNPPSGWLEEVEKLKIWFKSGGDKNVWKSFYIQYYTGPSQPSANDPVQHIFGAKEIVDNILGLDFKVSPNSFFQINTKGAEKLYSIVSDYCSRSLEDDTSKAHKVNLVDVCCGTGTIGICITSHLGMVVNKLIGVEMCESAVEDAVKNAAKNKILNAEFIASKAEDVLGKTLSHLNEPVEAVLTASNDKHGDNKKTKVVAIVDPPRAGLHPSVIQALRTCKAIDCLVYVSCNPKGSFIEDVCKLCLPRKKNLKGHPYKPVRATSVDMFPHSKHCEIVMQLEHDFSKS